MEGDLSSEYGTHKTVKARFRPWLSGESPQHLFRCSRFTRNLTIKFDRTWTSAHRAIRTARPSTDPCRLILSLPLSGIKFRVSGSGFRVSGLEFGVCESQLPHADPPSTNPCRLILSLPPIDLIRTSIYDKSSGSIKITTHLDRISHCKTSSGTNWSNSWTCRVFIYHKYSPRLDPRLVRKEHRLGVSLI